MPRQQSIQYVRMAAEACILQPFDGITQSDQTTTGREVEDTQCSGHGESPAASNIDAITVIDQQEITPDLDRKQDRSSFAVVKTP